MNTVDDRLTVPCGRCGRPTPMTGTKRCDGCWELETRVRADPVLTRKILRELDGEAKQLLRVQVAYRQGIVRTYLVPGTMLLGEFAALVARFGKVASIRGLREVRSAEDAVGALDLRAAPGRGGAR